MNFNELEKLMAKRGINSLADIARALNTTPQAVSNWKSRNKIPYRIITHLKYNNNEVKVVKNSRVEDDFSFDYIKLILTILKNLKLLVFIPIVIVSLTIFYLFNIADVKYLSTGSILATGGENSTTGGLSALASDFGISLGSSNADFSSSDMFPVILRSNTLAKEVIYSDLDSTLFNRRKNLYEILVAGKSGIYSDTLEEKAIEILQKDIFSFVEDRKSKLVTLYIRTYSPILSAKIAKIIIEEADKMQREYKIEKVSEKRKFIENRIETVSAELLLNETYLKNFREKNRQIDNSPSLLLEQERLERNKDVITDVFTTLKQQYEMVKIEEVEKSAMLQILDSPRVPSRHDQPRRARTTIFSAILSILISFGIIFIKEKINSTSNKQKILLLRKTFLKNLISLIPFRRKK